MKSFFVVLGLVIPATAFVSPHPANLRTAGGGRLRDSSVDEMIENIKEDFQAKYRISSGIATSWCQFQANYCQSSCRGL
jgi:hypothetical protein